MIKLKKVIQQLTEDDYHEIGQQFRRNRAEKFHSLFRYLRESEIPEHEISLRLGLNKTAYYTLKSRLYEKIQEFLFEHVKDPRIELLSNVANVHNLIYNTPKDTAIAVLKKLEKELTEYDMPNELIAVYNALKKLHLSSPKYYEYTQLYNKHVAYTLALDKAEDLLSRFTKSIGEFWISRDAGMIELLNLMKAEMGNVFRLYESHHLAIYRNIMNISYALFIPGSVAGPEEDSVEGMLNESWKIFEENQNDAKYQFLRTVFDFLAFEYYHGLKLYKNETVFFTKVNNKLDTFLLADHCCFTARFLISKVERSNYLGTSEKLMSENKNLAIDVSKEDVPNYIYFMLYKAASAFYSHKYSDVVHALNALLNAVSFKNILHAEMEVKLFLGLNYSLMNKHEQTEILIKSISRKLNEREDCKYENVQAFVRLLKGLMMSEAKDSDEKLRKLRDKFELENESENRILGFLKLDDAFIGKFSRSIKEIKI
jgi:hypothetical protein